MTFDYDLVILGGSAVARYVAWQASQLRARVALVEPPSAIPATLTSLHTHALIEAGQLLHDGQRVQHLLRQPIALTQPTSTQPTNQQNSQPAIQQWAHTVATAVTEQGGGYSLAGLAASGVDVIAAQGTFAPLQPRRSRTRPATPLIQTNERTIRSRFYLLAPASQPVIPAIEGLAQANYLTIDSLAQQNWQVPDRLIIVGGSPHSLELAQLFNRLGTQVTLIVGSAQLLPQEDPEMMALLQAQLEAEGIDILTHTRISQVKQLGEQIWVQAAEQALEADRILLATGRVPVLEHLNLEAMGVERRSTGVVVNTKLQTTHPHIYACSEALGGYFLPHLAQQEADLALHNMLLFSSAQVNYTQIPWAVFTHPAFARVGLTEAQARRFYGEDVVILKQPLHYLLKTQLRHDPVGFAKLILQKNGSILGAHLIGTAAAEWISPIALAMQHRIKLQNMGRSAFIAPAHSEVLAHLIDQWQIQRRPNWQKELLEGWFNFRRS